MRTYTKVHEARKALEGKEALWFLTQELCATIDDASARIAGAVNELENTLGEMRDSLQVSEARLVDLRDELQAIRRAVNGLAPS